jgi:hypothetical protein
VIRAVAGYTDAGMLLSYFWYAAATNRDFPESRVDA